MGLKDPLDDRGNPIKLVRFLLVSQPRSGSTWVLSKLATHPCVISRAENGHEKWGESGGCKNVGCFEGYFREARSGRRSVPESFARAV